MFVTGCEGGDGFVDVYSVLELQTFFMAWAQDASAFINKIYFDCLKIETVVGFELQVVCDVNWWLVPLYCGLQLQHCL